MKKTRSIVFLLIGLCTFFNIQSCMKKSEDMVCEGIICQNGGICLEGTCDCPVGYFGTNCELIDNALIQAMLNSGQTPKEIFDAGIPLIGLYGRKYKDGLIFYLNTSDGSGMIAATNNQANNVEWGCFSNNIPELNDVESFPTNNEQVIATRIGDGFWNTNSILAGCNEDVIAAQLCRNIGSEWFLPSRAELNLMWENLADSDGDGENPGPSHFSNKGNFADGTYWTSTESTTNFAWFQYFGNGLQGASDKNSNYHVRAASAF